MKPIHPIERHPVALAATVTVILYLVIPCRTFAADFRHDDAVLILVEGAAAQSRPWGLSGLASMYLADRTTADGKLGFTVVRGSKDISCERRSAKKVNSPFDYSTSGQIPPGIYFVSYHRLDPKGDRHRLAMGDRKSGRIIEFDNVKRTDIQFHQAANNLRSYTPRLSEGCIIFDDVNFRKLFPSGFLNPETSPLAKSNGNRTSARVHKGAGRVLAFITDATDQVRRKRQLALFKKLTEGQGGGLAMSDYANESKRLNSIREQWKR